MSQYPNQKQIQVQPKNVIQGHPPQGHPPQGYPPQGHPPQGHPPQGYPPQGYPPQGHPPQGHPPQGYPQQGYPPHGYPPQGYPPQGYPQHGYPPQGHPQYGHPPPQIGNIIHHIFGPNDSVFVKQKVEPLEWVTGFETNNKYSCKFKNGLKVTAAEKTSMGLRLCLGANRPFTIMCYFKDTKQKFLRLEREFRWFFHHVNVINHITNKKIGSVTLQCSLFDKVFSVKDAQDKEVYKIISECLCGCWTFKIKENGEVVGVIRKKWSGIIAESYTDADNFGINFPPKATPEMKAVLFGATFLIDFLYFEKSANSNNNRRRRR